MALRGNRAWRGHLYAANATLRDSLILENTRGVNVTFNVSHNDSVDVRWTTILEPYVEADHNNVSGNAFAGVYLRGTVWNGTTYPVFANLTAYNTISGNGYGVWIDGRTTNLTADRFWMWWNDIGGNSQQGVHVEGNTSFWGSNMFFHAYCNWWDDALGPNDPSPGLPDQWTNPAGQAVSDYFYYRERNYPPPPYQPKGWLNRTAGDPLAACEGGV